MARCIHERLFRNPLTKLNNRTIQNHVNIKKIAKFGENQGRRPYLDYGPSPTKNFVLTKLTLTKA